MPLTCTTCNAENPDSAVFCEECGIELGDSDAGLDTASTLEAEPLAEPDALEETVLEPVAAADDQDGGGTSNLDEVLHAPETEVPMEPATTDIPPASLTLISFGQSTDTVIPLKTSPLMLGKFDPAQGPIDIDLSNLPGNEYLSRRHGELFFDDGWTVRDLGSTNGVFVRRSKDSNFLPRLQGPMKLEDGDEVAFGNLRFMFRLSPDQSE
ncbi:MAG: FHA domain-containing protein [Caldilineaceae bacterium SB0662_bin_9]|uniref:FHA domain-containing protein n=1 Tax=Caldilineaceae bacterium SB0662_bin_9 TaxID=2605258 RepID=A0A6B1DUG5_9CHLR|nr:FHA domain-containing protein [Caldilineaceae bacterium SB0662_bin_9]